MSVSAKRNARIELTAGTAGVDRGLNDAKRKMRTFEREQARAAKQAERDAARKKKKDEKDRAKAMDKARGLGSSVAQGMGMALGLDAAGGVKGIVDDVMDYNRALTRLQITADKSPEVMRAFSDEVEKASNATGLSKNDILGAASAYVALTGDMKTAQASTATWAKIAQATNTPINDIASTAAAMTQQMGITSGDMETVFSGLAAQGKAGAVELKDLAGLMAQIAPQWAMFENGKGARGVAELGSALQIVKRGFGGDASETVTGLQSLLTAVTKNAGRFEDAGVKVFNVGKDGKKSMRDVFSIVQSIADSKLVKDPEAMEKAFGRVEAYRAYLQLSQNRKELERLTQAASDGQVIQRDFDTYMGSSAGKMEQAWTKIKNAIADAFTPERLDGFANAIANIADKADALGKTLGIVGDALGGMYHVGQKVRGFLSDDVNPFGGDFDAAKDHQTINGTGAWIATGEMGPGGMPKMVERDSEEGRRLIEQAKLRSANRAGFGGSVDSIMGAERDEKTTKESLAAAAGAFYSGNLGSSEAGRRYLVAAGVGNKKNGSVDQAQVEEIVRGVLKGTAEEFGRNMRDSFTSAFGNLAIQIGSEPIQKAGANSIQHRRGQH